MRLPAAPFAASSSDLLYVGNGGNNSITVYHTDASGDAAPIAVIKGSKTQLNNPGQLSGDSSGDLYVANIAEDSILVFKHGANGNVAPLRVIAGPRTGISDPNNLEAVTVDQTTGKIFAMVVDPATAKGYAELIRFPPNASGDEPPYAISKPNVENAFQLASDSTGNNIIDASYGHCCSAIYDGIYTYEKQFYTGGGTALYGIDDFVATGVADDPATKTYLVTGTDSRHTGIFRFKEDTVGDGGYLSENPPSYTPSLVSFLTVPPNCTLSPQLALGYLRSIFVSCGEPDAIYVYEHDASGNAKPLRILSGSKTKLNVPYGLYEGK
jgi:hypothetical protein